MTGYLTALVPSIGVLAIFWIAIRAMVQADRRERIAQARLESLSQTGESAGAPKIGSGEPDEETGRQ